MMGAEGAVRGAVVMTVVLVGGCREFHEPLPFDECHPYELQCATCLFDEDAAAATGQLRLWRCEDPVVGQLDAVMRDAMTVNAVDVRYYSAETGLRIGAERVFDEPTDVCGRELDSEWYGTIIEDCVASCEYDDTLEEAHPGLAPCAGIQ